jgi:hypothetical protein
MSARALGCGKSAQSVLVDKKTKKNFYFLSQFSTYSSQRSGNVFPEVLGLDLHVTLAPEADLLQDPVLAGRGHTEVGVYFSLQKKTPGQKTHFSVLHSSIY